MGKFKGSRVGSLNRLRSDLKKGQGNFIRRVPKEDVLVVRFLSEPDGENGFVRYETAYDPDLRRSYIVTEGTEPPKDHTVSTRYLAAVLDVEEDKVIPLELAKTMVSKIIVRYDKRGTIMDRNYELFRTGEGRETEYYCDPGDMTKIKLDKYDVPDLEAVLEEMVEQQEAEEESDEKTTKPSSARKAASKAAAPTKKGAAKKAAAKPVEPEEEDDDEDEEEEEVEEAPKKGRGRPVGSKNKPKPQPEPEEDEEEEEEDDEDEEFEEDADADDDEDEDEDEEYTEEELNAMSLADLRATAKQYSIDTTGMKKKDLINAILYDDEEED